MIALGFSSPDAQAGEPFRTLRCGPAGILAAPVGLASGPRERLALQVRALDRLPAFLPMSPRQVIDVDEARGWLGGHAEEVRDALVRYAGQLQLRIDVADRSETPSMPAPRGLRARAGARRARERRRDRAVAACLDNMGAAGMIDRRVVSRRNSCVIDVLAARSDIPRLATALRTGLEAGRLSGLTVTVTGPWPVLSFGPQWETRA